MRLGAHGAHLTYCTNIHAGETWSEVKKNVESHVVRIKHEVCPGAPFGVGLRLSAAAAEELSAPAELEAFRSFLAAEGLYVFTINGFPYGAFHGARVKERVYLPDWLEEPRLAYTDRLATLLAELLPEGSELEGSVSTSPGAFKPRVQGSGDVRAMAERMIRHAATLHRLRETTGKTISLAIEPEPACHLETIDEAICFFREQLFSRAAIDDFMRITGVGPDQAEVALHTHLGLCFDACHMAVEFEEPRSALQRLAAAGIRIGKVQISAGLEASTDRIDALRAFDDGVYLHQVVERRAGRLLRYVDLPDALAEDRVGHPTEVLRVHCHVPIFREKLGAWESTQRYLAEVLSLLRASPASSHLEVETYTWDVLPPEYRTESIEDAVARELRWVVGEMTRS